MRPETRLCVVDTIADLQSRGFTFDFGLADNKLLCSQKKIFLKSSEFEIQELYYFPRDMEAPYERMVYAIEARRYDVKGILMITGAHNFNLFPAIITEKLQEKIFERKHLYDNGIL